MRPIKCIEIGVVRPSRQLKKPPSDILVPVTQLCIAQFVL